MERGITTVLWKYEGPLKNIIKNYYAKKLENLEEMGTFLDLCKLTKVNYEDTENLSKSIMNDEIELVIISLPMKKSPGPESFIGRMY